MQSISAFPAAAAIACAACFAAAQEAAPMREAEGALEARPGLLAQHRGYAAWLGAHPAAARAEMDWLAVQASPAVWSAAAGFDEALRADPAAGQLFDAFYDRLSADAPLRRAAEGVDAAGLELGAAYAQAMAYLRANPGEALRFLDNPGGLRPLPAALESMARYLRVQPEARAPLAQAFGALLAQPGAQAGLAPWWQAAAAGGPAAPYARLAETFARHPQRFWVWHARQLRWAEAPAARAWARHLYRAAWRTPGLGYRYEAYLRAMHADPQRAAAAEARWQAAHGAAPAWPPPGAPPALPALDPARAAGAPPDAGARAGRPARPAKPTAARPAMPAMPQRPERPRKPELRTHTPAPRGK